MHRRVLTKRVVRTTHYIGVRKLDRKEILEQAQGLICGDRQQTYGDASKSFETIGALWTLFLERKENPTQLSGYDVAYMMSLMKVSRLMNGYHEDSNRDLIGYSALACELANK
jgi:hypothetical protein